MTAIWRRRHSRAGLLAWLVILAPRVLWAASCLQIAAKILGPDDLPKSPSKSDLARAVISASHSRALPVLTDQSDLLAEAARVDMGMRSRNLTRMLEKAPDDAKMRHFNVGFIGGGPSAASALPELAGARSLVINDSGDMGAFSRFGDTFYTNSGEFPGKPSPNLMPGNEVQVQEIANRTYSPGRVFGNATEINLSLSDADFQIGVRATNVRRARPGELGKYIVETSGGEKFSFDTLAVGTGIGTRKFPFNDKATQELIKAEYESGKPRVRFIDDFLAAQQDLARQGELPLKSFGGKSIAVVGPGHGGAIGAEYVLGHAPPAGYAFRTEEITNADLPTAVHWFGQKNKTGAEYKASEWERYWGLGDEIDAGRIRPVDSRAERIELIKDGPDKDRLRIWHGNESVVVDEVIVAGGYDGTGPSKLLSGLVADAHPDALKLEYVKGHVEGIQDPVNLAKRVHVNGQAEDIYVIGPATEGLNTVGEPGGESSPRIEVMGKRNAALFKQIRGTIANPEPCLTCAKRAVIPLEVKASKTASSVEMPIKNAPIRVSSEAEREVRVQMRLASIVDHLKLKGGNDFELQLVPNADRGTLELVSRQLPEASLKKLRDVINSDQELVSLIGSQPKMKINKSVKVVQNKETRADVAKQISFTNPEKGAKQSFGASELTNTRQAIEFKSRAGRGRLDDARRVRLADDAILANYSPQKFRTTCGVASSCIVLNSMGVENPASPGKAFTQDGFLRERNRVKAEPLVIMTEGRDPGLTLSQLAKLIKGKGANTRAVFARQPEADGAASLREAIKKNFEPGGPKVVLNFHGQTLGANSGGHFSPIAAYHPKTDSVLVMDVARHKNDPFWIPVPDLYHAMTKIDSTSGRPRGYVLVSPPSN